MSGLRPSANLLTIPAGVDFLDVLATSLLDGELGLPAPLRDDAFALADAVIYVPTRRAAQGLRAAFASAAGRPVLLPRIRPLGGLSEIEDGLLLDDMAGLAEAPQALADLERRFHLTRLTAAWSAGIKRALAVPGRESAEALAVGATLGDAFGLAGELAGLVDELILSGVPWSRLAALAPDHDAYWRLTADFLTIVSETWPRHLAEQHLEEAAARQNALLAAEAERLGANPPMTPVIVAGSTGSIPATARLMRVIAHLPAGAVVLPGLDMELDEAGWQAVGSRDAAGMDAGRAGHPQAALKRLIDRLDVPRSEVRVLGRPPQPLKRRATIVSQALRPAERTDDWLRARADIPPDAFQQALAGVTLVEAADEHEEALAIALTLRGALEHAGSTAALVTPDRQLARRVAGELARWDIAAEDSAGADLALSPAGSLARLAIAVVESDFAAAALVQLLAHRDLALGWPPARLAAAAAALEIAVLRGQRLKPGLDGLRAALGAAGARVIDGRSPAPLRRIDAARLAEAGALLERLAAALAPLATALTATCPIHDAARALGDSVAALTEREAAEHDFAGRPDGAALLARLDEIVETGGCGLVLGPGGFGPLLDALLAGIAIPARGGGHPRLRIFGLLEARLLSVDLVVLGGLNEGTWPPAARNDVFLNRQMRAELGLDPPERRLGQTAHDFAQGLGAPQVVLTRAMRVEGAPSVPARFLQRLSAFCGAHIDPARARGAATLALARLLDRPDDVAGSGVPRPAPAPPLALRPQRLSVTAIETLYRDPYAIFARHILDLAPLEALAPGFTAADRGNLVHEALHAYLRAAPESGDRHARLLAAGHAVFAPFMDDPEVAGFWWPGYLRIAAWLAGWEEARAADTLRSVPEISGALALTLGDTSAFRLTGRADRIDVMRDGRLAVIDYKTGMPPGVAEVVAGHSPQLTLEAAMIAGGAFKDVPAGEVAELIYLRLSGRGAGGEERAIQPKDQTLQALCEAHLAELVADLTRYRDPATGYLSRRMPRKRQEFGDYDHLARVKEWSDTAGAADDDGEEGEP